MNTKPQIKLIKRSQQTPKQIIKTKTPQTAAREMVSTVTEWVTEFQQKRREETQEAVNKFFPNASAPSGCGNC